MFNRLKDMFRTILGIPSVNESTDDGKQLNIIKSKSKSKSKSKFRPLQNERTISREILLQLEPELVQKIEAITPRTGIEQLRDDVQRGLVKFKGVLLPKEHANLEIDDFKKSMTNFLLNQGFSKNNITRLLTCYSSKLEVRGPNAGIEQLRNDVRKGLIRFHGVLAPDEYANLETNEFKIAMQEFLLNVGFSENSMDFIFKCYSSNPASSLKLGQKLLASKFEKQSNLDPAIIYNLPTKNHLFSPKKLINNIFEKDNRIFFETIANKYPIKNTDDEIEIINEEFKSLFELTNNGFKLINYKTINLFSDLINKRLSEFSLDEQERPLNERIFPRHLLLLLEPDRTKIAEEVERADAGILQLQNDIMTIKFQGIFAPEYFKNLKIDEFKKAMVEFLLELKFSEINIYRIFKHYSQRPSYAVHFGGTLLSLKYNEQRYPNEKNIHYSPPSNYTSNIFEKGGEIFFETSGTDFSIKNDYTEIVNIKDKLQSLFKLKDDGFKLEHIKAFGLFTYLMERFLNDISSLEIKEGIRSKQEINDWIFTYCLAANPKSKVDHAVRKELIDRNFSNIINALSDPVLYRRVAYGLYENGLYFAKKYKFGGGAHCGYQQLIDNLTSHYSKLVNGPLMKYGHEFDELYHKFTARDTKFKNFKLGPDEMKKFFLNFYPGRIREQLKNKEIIPTIAKIDRDKYDKSLLTLLDQLHDFSRNLSYLTTISIKKKNASSNLILFKQSTPQDQLKDLLKGIKSIDFSWNEERSTKSLRPKHP